MVARVLPEVLGEMLEVLWFFPRVELWRRRLGFHESIAVARARGAGRRSRSRESRDRLRQLIGAIDRRLPDGGNCVRRAMLEMSLDKGAANETLFAGISSRGGPKSGHALLASDDAPEQYDAVFSMAALI